MSNSGESSLQEWATEPFLAKVTGVAPGIIYVFNQQTQSNEYTNRSMGESLGYTSVEIKAMGDAMLPSLCHPQDLPQIGSYFETLSKMPDGDIAHIEYRMRHKEGHWVWLLSYDTIFERNENGDVVRHIGVATDISLQKKAEEQAIAGRRAADAANEELRSFAYSISHDIKAPSNTLRLLLSELKEQHAQTFNDDARHLLNLSLDTVGRMQTVVEDVLNYTRVVGEQAAFVNVDLQELVRDIVALFHADILHCEAKLIVEDLPVVAGSPVQLRILFQNLIGNAIKFRDSEKQPQITIRRVSSDNDDLIHVQVSDNGIGIEEQHHHKIFTMFKRLHLADEYPGTGLGLAICNRVALIHGGNISVNSSVGNGASFTVSLKQNG